MQRAPDCVLGDGGSDWIRTPRRLDSFPSSWKPPLWAAVFPRRRSSEGVLFLRIHHVVARIADEASGPSQTVPALCLGLQDRGHDVTLHVLEPLPSDLPDIRILGYKSDFAGTNLGRSRAMKAALAHAALNSDVFHVHGLWLMPNIYPARLTRRSDTLLVISPHGMLSPVALSYSRLRKQLFWHALQRRVLLDAGLLHAIAEPEAHDIRQVGLNTPVAVIPNGVVVPRNHARPSSRRRLLFLGRLHPIKGLENLLVAWSRLQDDFLEWDLVIAGPGEPDYLVRLHRLATELRVRRVEFVGGVFGNQKSEVFWTSSLFVLPSRSESFAVAVAEALAHGLPVLVTEGTPWQHVVAEGCGWCVGTDALSIEQGLRIALSEDADVLSDMGRRGKRLVQAEYSWERLTEMMEFAYLWALGRVEKPPWVRVSS